MEKDTYDVIIAGAGPAGLTCALYCARAGLSVVCLDRGMFGGQMTTTEWIDNYPGFPEGIGGNELGEIMMKQAQRFGAEVTYGNISSVPSGRDAEGIINVNTDDGILKCRAFVIATGAAPRELGVPGESDLRGRGVSYCAVCDGFFFKDHEVCVVGGGDAAVEEAVYLSNLCKKVTIIHRRDRLRAAKAAEDSARSRSNIEFAFNSQVLEVLGNESGVTGVRVADVESKSEREIPCTGIFFYVGILPATDTFKDIVKTDDRGFIVTNEDMETSVEGIYAAGDVRRPKNRQVSTAVGDGATAALSIERILNEQPDRFR